MAEMKCRILHLKKKQLFRYRKYSFQYKKLRTPLKKMPSSTIKTYFQTLDPPILKKALKT